MPITQVPSLLFTVGRACAGPLAIVLHEVDQGIEMLDHEMTRCPTPRPAQSPGCHSSFHFGIGGNCHFHQYIDIANTAWGFGLLPPVLCPPPNICPPEPCASCTGLTADQYNTNFDGIPPVIPPFVAGPDGTANCGVIHVAIQSIFPSNITGVCCEPNPDAYRCLVRSLCELFDLAGLVPSLTTLLAHCGELVCLDLEQLVADIIACLNAPPPVVPPCTCAPTPAQLCQTLAGIADGAVAVPGVTSFLADDCLFHLLPVVDVTIVPLDTATIDMVSVEAPANTFTLSANLLSIPPAVLCDAIADIPAGDPGVAGVDSYIGPDCEIHLLPVADVTLVPLDTATVDMVIAEAPTNTFTISANVDTAAVLAVLETCDGPYVDQTLVTTEAWAASLPAASPARIWTSPSEADCPTSLIGVEYDELLLPAVNVVLGVNQVDDETVVWGRVQNPALVIDTFTDANSTLLQNVDVHMYIGIPGHNVDLNPPTNGRNHIWIKNLSANSLVVTSTSGAIDGVAQITIAGTIPAGYPFGNNGGASVHLIWDGSDWYVI